MNKVECKLRQIIHRKRKAGRYDKTMVSCSKCGKMVQCNGSGDGSIRSCLASLRSSCPKGERNFYFINSEDYFESSNTNDTSYSNPTPQRENKGYYHTFYDASSEAKKHPGSSIIRSEDGIGFILKIGPSTGMDKLLETPASFFYEGGLVSNEVFQAALDFFVALEGKVGAAGEPNEYDELCDKYRGIIAMAESAIKKFALQIEPKTLENMQELYYLFTNDPKNRQSYTQISVITATINDCWDGIGSWRK